MITIIDTEMIDESKQWVYITVDVLGETLEHTTIQPFNNNEPVLSGQELQDYLDSQEDRYKLEILKDMYKDAKVKGKTLQDLIEWVQAGALNDEDGELVQVIKRKIEGRHPKRLKIIEQIDNASSLPDIKAILKKIVRHES